MFRKRRAETITVDYPTTCHLMALSNVVTFIQSADGPGMDALAAWAAGLSKNTETTHRERIIASTLAAASWADDVVKTFIESGTSLPIRWKDE